jgi:acyl-CoA thioesterase
MEPHVKARLLGDFGDSVDSPVAPGWSAISIEQLLTALDLRSSRSLRGGQAAGFRIDSASPHWPALPGAQLAASVVIAAERTFPGYSVRHLSCALGPAASADVPVELAVGGMRSGDTSITARMAFTQSGAVRGEAGVLLVRQTERPAAPRRMAEVAPAEMTALDVGIVPWVVQHAAPEESTQSVGSADSVHSTNTGNWQGWSDIRDVAVGGTLSRALLVYLAEAVTAPASTPCYPRHPVMSGPALRATVLNHAISFLAPVNLDDGLVLSVSAPAAAEGFLHAVGEFRRAADRLPVVRVSQALAVRRTSADHGASGPRRRRHLGLVREG